MFKILLQLLVSCLLSMVAIGQIDSNEVFEKSKGLLDHPVSGFTKLEKSGSDNNGKGCWFGASFFYSIPVTESVKAIFEGRVVAIFEIEGIQTVMTKYGDYFIVYSGLSALCVSKGDYVLRGQSLGKIPGVDYNPSSFELHFLKKADWLDPGLWISKSIAVSAGLK